MLRKNRLLPAKSFNDVIRYSGSIKFLGIFQYPLFVYSDLNNVFRINRFFRNLLNTLIPSSTNTSNNAHKIIVSKTFI